MSEIFLSRIAIQDFRTFGDFAIDIPAAPGLVLLTGTNGLGTSSFFDVIHDIKFSCQKVANPLYGETKNQKRFIQNHKGFYGTSLNTLLKLIFFLFFAPYYSIVIACL
jgi:predicted ATP-binding protein involved in virulence